MGREKGRRQQGQKIGKGNSSKKYVTKGQGLYDPGALKLDPLQPVKLIRSQKCATGLKF